MAGLIKSENLDIEAFDKGTDTLDQVTAGTTNKHFTDTEKTKLTGIFEGADVTDSTNVTAALDDIVNAHSIITSFDGSSISQVAIAENTVLGRLSGNTTALTAGDIRTLINVENGANAVEDTDDVPNISSVSGATLTNALDTLDGKIALVESGLISKAHVRLATTSSDGNLSLTGAANVDGSAVVTGDSILVKNQSDETQNGVYIANTEGAWTRRADSDGNPTNEIRPGTSYWVVSGSENVNTRWSQYEIGTEANQAIDVGTDDINFINASANAPLATTSTAGLMSATDKERLDDLHDESLRDSDFVSAQSVLVAITAETPTNVVVAEGSVVGRSVGGNVGALAKSDLLTILNLRAKEYIHEVTAGEISQGYIVMDDATYNSLFMVEDKGAVQTNIDSLNSTTAVADYAIGTTTKRVYIRNGDYTGASDQVVSGLSEAIVEDDLLLIRYNY